MRKLLAFATGLAMAATAHGAGLTVKMNFAETTGPAAAVGTVRIIETRYGVVFEPELSGRPPGLHGIHVHENGSCAPQEKDGKPVPALAAGGHHDPQGTNKHGTSWGDGHLGDLPALVVASDGSAHNAVLALANRPLMIHAGGDNHSDHPAPLGGGGARIACGVIGA